MLTEKNSSVKTNGTSYSFANKFAQLLTFVFCEFCENSKNTYFYRTHPVAASEDSPGKMYHQINVCDATFFLVKW